jgi:glyoxylase-like metal-dependent hydrolase (beta-lactamase superfamily II)
MRVGDTTLRLVSDGEYRLDGAGLFGLMPKTEWQELAEPDEHNRIRIQLHCLLIEAGQHKILVDTGYGDKLSDREREFMCLQGDRRLLGNLAALGVMPEDIDLVINTHLHGDHCGGNTRYNEDGNLVPTFPYADYYVQRLELADAIHPNERTRGTYHPENWEPLERTGQLRVLWGDTRLTDEVRVVVTPGHTPAHQSVVVESGGETAVFLADTAHWPLHIERLEVLTAFDVQPLVTLETKRRLARWAIEHRALLIFNHHPDGLAGYLHPTDRPDRFRLEPVPFRGQPSTR